MKISISVIAYNEATALPGILANIKEQTYPHNLIEVILIDSMSDDSTRQIMDEFTREDNGFYNIQVLENPKRIQAAGWNVVLRNYSGDVLLKIDAHAMLPLDFVQKNVDLLNSGEDVAGGIRPSMVDESTPWKETLLLAEQSKFGSGIASYRSGEKKCYVKSLFHGAYRREVFDKVGEFNESLGRTEDNEMNYRIQRAGYRLCYSPDIISYQHVRNSLGKMMKQKYGNGKWVILTLKVCPGCLSFFHFISFIFVISIFFTTALALIGYPLLMIVMWSLYWIMAIFMAFVSVRNIKKSIYQIALPFLFLLLHISYGVGSLVGFIKLPFWHVKQKKGM